MKFLIRFYQKTISPDHGPFRRFFPHGYCRFYPSCSEYAYQSIDKHGYLKGIKFAARRLMKCHPWSPFGHDPVP